MKTIVLIFSLSVISLSLQAQTEQEKADEELVKKAQNPVANMISVPFQNNTSYGIGPDKRTANVLNVQPVIPIGLGKKWNLITRTIIPIVTVPDFTSTEKSSITGLGDINLSLFFSPKESKLIWGIGPILALPTATDPALGAQEFGVGPSLVVVHMAGKWVLGATVNQTWSVASNEVSKLLIQYFINYNLPDSWYLSSAPIITANWNAESANQWVIPFGGTVGKLFRLGKLPINAQAGAFYNAVKPDGGADWQTRFQLQFLFPK